MQRADLIRLVWILAVIVVSIFFVVRYALGYSLPDVKPPLDLDTLTREEREELAQLEYTCSALIGSRYEDCIEGAEKQVAKLKQQRYDEEETEAQVLITVVVVLAAIVVGLFGWTEIPEHIGKESNG